MAHRALLLAFCSSLFAPNFIFATELTDLGQGLAYLSIQSLADSEKALRSAVPAAGALVLDLRHVAAKEDSLDALRFALGSHTASTPLFILVSPATPPAVAEIIKESSTPALTLGVAGSAPGPRVVIRVDAETDRRAYEALAAGTPVAQLISGKIEKERYDEAMLVQEFKSGNLDAAPPPAPDPTATKPALPGNPAERGVSGTFAPAETGGRTLGGQQAVTGQPGPAAAGNVAPLIDHVLQRAVHLHHALLALRR